MPTGSSRVLREPPWQGLVGLGRPVEHGGMSNNIDIQTRNGYGTTLSAVINFPPGFDESEHYPAVVVSHPGGGVKEQTAGLYAAKVAEAGFVTIAYDASFQGASTGTPRQLENPAIRTEDVSAVIDYFTTLPYVDDDRIGAMGICAGAGYTVNAAIDDPRIKAVGTVSMVNIGQMFRNGWDSRSPTPTPPLCWSRPPKRGPPAPTVRPATSSRWRRCTRRTRRTPSWKRPGSTTTRHAASTPTRRAG